MNLLGYMLEQTLKEVKAPAPPVPRPAVSPTHKKEEKETSLYYDFGTSDKVYYVFIRCVDDSLFLYDVVVKWGRRGSTLQSMKKATSVSWSRAQNVYSTVIQEKISKGYKVKP